MLIKNTTWVEKTKQEKDEIYNKKKIQSLEQCPRDLGSRR